MYGRTHSIEARKKMSEKLKGENHPFYGKRGKESAFYGKKHSEETKNKMKESYRSNSPDIIEKNRKSHLGEKNPAWNGGSSKFPYAPDWGPKVKQKVFERDGFVCKNPDCRGENESLVPHHINYDKTNCDSTNLITLCKSCNGRANKDRKKWQRIYEEKKDR